MQAACRVLTVGGMCTLERQDCPNALASERAKPGVVALVEVVRLDRAHRSTVARAREAGIDWRQTRNRFRDGTQTSLVRLSGGGYVLLDAYRASGDADRELLRVPTRDARFEPS